MPVVTPLVHAHFSVGSVQIEQQTAVAYHRIEYAVLFHFAAEQGINSSLNLPVPAQFVTHAETNCIAGAIAFGQNAYRCLTTIVEAQHYGIAVNRTGFSDRRIAAYSQQRQTKNKKDYAFEMIHYANIRENA